jgi:hypothetical protein
VLFEFAFPGRASHSHVFDCPAETGKLMPFEMGQHDQSVGMMDIRCNLGVLDVAGIQGYCHAIVSSQPVCDYGRGAGHLAREAVVECGREVGMGFPA